MAGTGEEESISRTQTHKAAIHCTVGRICEEVAKQCDMTFPKHVIAVLTEVTHRQLTLYAGDLEAYASHAKRTVVNPDDVKLMVRRNPHLVSHIGAMIEKIENEDGRKKKGAKRGRKRKKNEEEEEEKEEQEERQKEETERE